MLLRSGVRQESWELVFQVRPIDSRGICPYQNDLGVPVSAAAEAGPKKIEVETKRSTDTDIPVAPRLAGNWLVENWPPIPKSVQRTTWMKTMYT